MMGQQQISWPVLGCKHIQPAYSCLLNNSAVLTQPIQTALQATVCIVLNGHVTGNLDNTLIMQSHVALMATKSQMLILMQLLMRNRALFYPNFNKN